MEKYFFAKLYLPLQLNKYNRLFNQVPANYLQINKTICK